MKKKIIPFILAIATLSISQYASASTLLRLCQEARTSLHDDFKIVESGTRGTGSNMYNYIKSDVGVTYKIPSIQGSEADRPKPIGNISNTTELITAINAMVAWRQTQQLDHLAEMMQQTAKQAIANGYTVSLCIDTTSEVAADQLYTAKVIQMSNN
ncbi:hypothetical protein ACVBEF_15740 [Glaciimonas sp. GG7]